MSGNPVETIFKSSKSFKVYLYPKNEIRRFARDTEPSWSAFVEFVQDLFSDELRAERFVVQYKDDEGDNVTVSSELEWEEAIRVQRDQPIRKIYLTKQGSEVVPGARGGWHRGPHCGRMRHICHRDQFLSNVNNNNSEELEVPEESALSHRQALKMQRRKARAQANNAAAAASSDSEEDDVQNKLKGDGLFEEGNLVHLRSKSSGKTLRILGDGTVNGKGGRGPKATFVVHRGKFNQAAIRLQNVADNKHWLRITGDGKTLDGLGRGGPFTEFLVVSHSDNEKSVSLRSAKNDKFGIAVDPNGDAKDPSAAGVGPNGRFIVSLAKKETVLDQTKAQKPKPEN